MRRLVLWAIVLQAGRAIGQSVSTPDMTRPPSVVVVIQVQPDGLHPISWTFDKRVPHDAVRQRIQQFSQWTQRSVSYIEIADDSLKRDAKPSDMLTVASFASGGLVDLREGTLNLTPIARTFADLPVVHVYVLLPQAVQYAGYFEYTTPHLQMWTNAEPAMWRSVINVSTPDPALLEIPLKRPQSKPQVETPVAPPARPPLGWLISLILIAAFTVGAGIFWIASKLFKRQTDAATVQPETDL